MKTRHGKVTVFCGRVYSGHAPCHIKENQICLTSLNFYFGKQYTVISRVGQSINTENQIL
jgi:hypothetical protein